MRDVFGRDHRAVVAVVALGLRHDDYGFQFGPAVQRQAQYIS